MTEDWRRALDKKQTVGIVFVDFRKAFDSISSDLLLQKLQDLGIAGDVWISYYLHNRTQTTTVNGYRSCPRTVKFGVPQVSILGPILFPLFYNELPDFAEDTAANIHMYADNTII